MTPPHRRQRSDLAVPASEEKFFLKAAQGATDALFLDLEDAVAPEKRIDARASAVAALEQIDWGDKILSVRVNGLTTRWSLDDILAVARCERLDMILLPKVESADDIVFLDRLLTGLELSGARQRPIGIQCLIETTRGLANVEAIAAASPRLEAMVFGVGDYSIDLQTFDPVLGTSNPDYAVLARDEQGATFARHWGDQWHFAMARIANACRAYGLRPIDGPFANFRDPEGYRASCSRARSLGFEGKWAIHPSQVELGNEAFTPSRPQIDWAQDVTGKMAAAMAAGQGAINHGGILVDMAHVKLAERILRQAGLA